LIKTNSQKKGDSIMQLAKWDPFREMEDVFGRYAKALRWPHKGSQDLMESGDWAPSVDILETEKEFVIKAEIPGVSKDDVKISVDNGKLTIRGEKKQEKEEKNKKFHRVEQFYGSFARSFTLPENVDETKIEAAFKNGMLKLQIPKTTVSKPKAIDIKIK
jgi:HSP20 family protein